ncbi:protein C2-DOMAIN ABA-RELATED 9 [Vigna radiata var. radiata]|uniref:Protein C2-DOMAIN ABA-RELATED 9 n=1 Tax=Vigna radiata var. radiata TaxID=3916 RepID=A0A1S3VQT3_VIGRR|nr:protein C2-DOMAIN ABA-RELATED 9 [Vigna radiata var. radiata]
MDNDVLGILKLRIIKGIDLAIRDSRASDPYVVVIMGDQKLKTRVIKNNCNPTWDEEMTLYVKDVNTPLHLTVYDKDTFTVDDKMGEAEIDFIPFLKCKKMELKNLPNGCAVKRIQPNRSNYLAEESSCVWNDGDIVQKMILRLKNVERGELVVQIQWVDVVGFRGLSHIKL